MSCDVNGMYRLNFLWANAAGTPPIHEEPFTDPPANTIPNIRLFTDWVTVLQLGSNVILCDYMTNYPSWFTQTPAPGIVTLWTGKQGTSRTGAVIAINGDYDSDMITPLGSTPGATVNEQIQYLFDNSGGGGTSDHLVIATVTDTTAAPLASKIDIVGFTQSIANPGANELVRFTQTGGGGTGTGGTFAVALYQDLAGGQTVPKNGDWQDIAFGTASLTTSEITRSGADKIFTFNTDGTYFISAKVTLASGYGRVRHEMRVVADTGAGYALVAATDSFGFTPNDALDEVTLTSSLLPFVAVATNPIKVQVRAISGTLDATTLGEKTSLHIFKLEVDATLPYTEVTGTSQAMVQGHRYTSNNGSLVTLTLPATAEIGTEISVMGKGAGGWRIAQNASQQIVTGAGATPGVDSTTAGVTGHLDSGAQYDSVSLICLTADLLWGIQNNTGTSAFT